MKDKEQIRPNTTVPALNSEHEHQRHRPGRTGETGGPKGLEPTRYGDWERKGRCIDF